VRFGRREGSRFRETHFIKRSKPQIGLGGRPGKERGKNPAVAGRAYARIFHMAGAQTPVGQTRDNLERAIREVGREPIQRDTFYKEVGGGADAT
jgi:hypothetical protein